MNNIKIQGYPIILLILLIGMVLCALSVNVR
jgi:cell division protein FtsL